MDNLRKTALMQIDISINDIAGSEEEKNNLYFKVCGKVWLAEELELITLDEAYVLFDKAAIRAFS